MRLGSGERIRGESATLDGRTRRMELNYEGEPRSLSLTEIVNSPRSRFVEN